MIKYMKGYQLKEPETFELGFSPADVLTAFIDIKGTKMTISKGYFWDGPSGPTFDTENFMRGSLVHDALYQLMRMGLVDRDMYRDKADRLLQKMCSEDGMSAIRAWWVYQAVKRFGKSSATA